MSQTTFSVGLLRAAKGVSINADTEAVLKLLGFCLHDSKPDYATGRLTWSRPREAVTIEILPTDEPPAIVAALVDVGRRAARKEISDKHQAFLKSLHE